MVPLMISFVFLYTLWWSCHIWVL